MRHPPPFTFKNPYLAPQYADDIQRAARLPHVIKLAPGTTLETIVGAYDQAMIAIDSVFGGDKSITLRELNVWSRTHMETWSCARKGKCNMLEALKPAAIRHANIEKIEDRYKSNGCETGQENRKPQSRTKKN